MIKENKKIIAMVLDVKFKERKGIDRIYLVGNIDGDGEEEVIENYIYDGDKDELILIDKVSPEIIRLPVRIIETLYLPVEKYDLLKETPIQTCFREILGNKDFGMEVVNIVIDMDIKFKLNKDYYDPNNRHEISVLLGNFTVEFLKELNDDNSNIANIIVGDLYKRIDKDKLFEAYDVFTMSDSGILTIERFEAYSINGYKIYTGEVDGANYNLNRGQMSYISNKIKVGGYGKFIYDAKLGVSFLFAVPVIQSEELDYK